MNLSDKVFISEAVLCFNSLPSKEFFNLDPTAVHHINTNNKHHLHRPNAKLSCFQKSTFSSGIKIFNSLPCSLKILKIEKTKFKAMLKRYLNTHFFTLYMSFLCVKMIHNTVV